MSRSKALSKSKIGVVIPAYNEGPVIGDVLRDISKVFAKLNTLIIVVNDGSTDNTASVVSKHKNVVLVNHIINMGAGAATRTGLDCAKSLDCDYVVTVDSDGQHNSKDALKLIQALQKDESDFIIGSRLINTVGMPWYRIFGNKLLNVITFSLFGVFVTDSQSGMKALNATSLQKLKFRSNNFAFCSEMIWQAKRAGLRIEEVAIKAIYTDYSLAKGQSNLDVVHILRQLFKQRLMDFLYG